MTSNPVKCEEVLTARAFRLKDEKGMTRALLTTLDSGRPSLLLFDSRGESRVEVGLQPNGAPKVILNCEDDVTLIIEVSRDGLPTLQVEKNGGKALVHLKTA